MKDVLPCGHTAGRHTCISGAKPAPEAGDYGMCWQCGKWWKATAAHTFEFASDEEMAQITQRLLFEKKLKERKGEQS
jgi:hypothetical protein